MAFYCEQALLPALRRRLAALFAGLAVLVSPALATWSLVVLNTKTGEVCVASATCIGNKFPLKLWLPVIVVERGGGVAQSMVDTLGGNRMTMWAGIQNGLLPARILDKLSVQDGFHQRRQYGIVTVDGPPITFTGDKAAPARYGVTGQVGDLIYAIQGNVLAGDAVVLETEKTLRASTGDLGQRVMAAMETARLWGGDGRCSCSGSNPPGCGSPPPSFTHSAYTSFIVLARPGDVDGVCNKPLGCANGNYYLEKVFKGKGPTDPDPVIELTSRYNAWRASMVGLPDHYLSKVQVDRELLVADGKSSASVRIQLVDVDGNPLAVGGDQVTVRQVSPGPATAIPGPVTDNGDGTYSLDLVATTTPGRGAFQVEVGAKGPRSILLRPIIALETSPLSELHVGMRAVSAATGGRVPFIINRGVSDAGRPYRILGGYSGSVPGFDYGGVHVPLNRDPFFAFTWTTNGNDPKFMRSAGALNPEGRIQALLRVPPGTWSALVGRRFEFCALLGASGGGGFDVTPSVGFDLEL
jgi:hypothetical protein